MSHSYFELYTHWGKKWRGKAITVLWVIERGRQLKVFWEHAICIMFFGGRPKGGVCVFFSSELSLCKMRTFSILTFCGSSQYWRFLSCELWTITLQLLHDFASINFKAKFYFFFCCSVRQIYIFFFFFLLNRVQFVYLLENEVCGCICLPVIPLSPERQGWSNCEEVRGGNWIFLMQFLWSNRQAKPTLISLLKNKW